MSRPWEPVGDAPRLERSLEEVVVVGPQEKNFSGSSSLVQPLLLREDELPIHVRDISEDQINAFSCENGDLRDSDSLLDPLAPTLSAGKRPPPYGLYLFYVCHGVQDELPSMALYLVLKSAFDVTPADYSFVSCLTWLPWALKPAVGYWSDTCKIAGRRRTPHVAIGVALNLLGCLLLSAYPYIRSKLVYLSILMYNSLAAVVAETAVDSLMAELSSAAYDEQTGSLQSSAWTCDAAGSVVGSVIPIVAFGTGLSPHVVLLLSASVVVLQALVIPYLPKAAETEHRRTDADPDPDSSLFRWGACRSDRKPDPILVKALVFFFLVSSTPTSGDAFTYFQTDVLKFSASFLSGTTVLQALSNWVTATAFTVRMRSWDARLVFGIAIVMTAYVNLLNLAVVQRWNVALGIPDEAFVAGSTVVQGAAGEMAFLPVAVLAARLAPAGREGTVYATAMAVVNVAWASSELFSGLLSRGMRVSEGQYATLPLYLLVVATVALFPLLFLCFVPDTTTRDADRPDEPAPSEVEEHDMLLGQGHEFTEAFDEDAEHRNTLLAGTR